MYKTYISAPRKSVARSRHRSPGPSCWHSDIAAADTFAARAHEGQRRKYTHDPYIVHPRAVSAAVSAVTDDHATIIAALLHDTVEDGPVGIDDIRLGFGEEVARMVGELTSPLRCAGVPRPARVAANIEHLRGACAKAQTVKLADIADNIISVAQHDPKFCKLYLVESWRKFTVLKSGHLAMRLIAFEALREAEKMIKPPRGHLFV